MNVLGYMFHVVHACAQSEGLSGEHYFVLEIKESKFRSAHHLIIRDLTSISDFPKTQFWGTSVPKNQRVQKIRNWILDRSFITCLISSTTFKDPSQLFLVLALILSCSFPLCRRIFGLPLLEKKMEELNSADEDSEASVFLSAHEDDSQDLCSPGRGGHSDKERSKQGGGGGGGGEGVTISTDGGGGQELRLAPHSLQRTGGKQYCEWQPIYL